MLDQPFDLVEPRQAVGDDLMWELSWVMHCHTWEKKFFSFCVFFASFASSLFFSPSPLYSNRLKMVHPFDILEIAEMVAMLLTPHSLAQCALVSRDWHQTFSPLLWSDCRLPQDLVSLEPALSEAWIRYAPVIRQLSTHKDFLSRNKNQEIELPFLHTLCIDNHDLLGFFYSWDLVLTFIRRHLDQLRSLTLKQLSLHRIFETNPPLTRHHAIGMVGGGGKRLTRLSLIGSKIDMAQWTDPIWESIKRLNSLSIENCTFESMDEVADLHKRLEGNRIQHLVLHSNKVPTVPHTERLWIEACPELRSLRWRNMSPRPTSSMDEEPTTMLFAKGLALGQWRFLNSLDLGLRRVQDHYIAEILASLQCGLQFLNLNRTGFGPFATTALLDRVTRPGWRQVSTGEPSLHRKTLEWLSVRDTSQVYSSTVQDFLCNLKNLKVFHASSDLTDREVMKDPRPWVCLDLVTLQLGFSLKARRDGPLSPLDKNSIRSPFSTVFLDRLATLTRLETLVVGAREKGSRGEQYIDNVRHRSQSFRLQDGLHRLKTLTQLREIQLGYSGQRLSVDEARWMVRHWPRLERIDVKNKDRPTASPFENWEEAWEIFKAHGVKSELTMPGM